MSEISIKTPRSKQAFREMISNLAPSESINWQHYDDWFGNIDITVKAERASSARAIITLRYSNGNEVKFDEFRDVDSVVDFLWEYRGGMSETGTFQRSLLEQACAIEELKISLDNITFDDGKELGDLNEQEIVEQAVYMLSMFNEEGTMQWDALVEDEDPDMIRQWHELRRFVKRYAS